jgi:monoamine oxidase
LSKRGFQVVVLEGQGRPGGRVQTLREGLYPGLSAETGATRIPDTHDFTLSYVHEFGLPLEVLTTSGNEVLRLRGQNYTLGHSDEPNWPLQLRTDERSLGRAALMARFTAPLEQVRRSEHPLSIPEPILALDRFTIREYLTERGLSPAAIELLNVGEDTSATSYALMLNVLLNAKISRNYFHVRGGNDQLPAAVAAKLGAAVRYGCKVVSIGQDDHSAWAVVEHARSCETVKGDYVVCASPSP